MSLSFKTYELVVEPIGIFFELANRYVGRLQMFDWFGNVRRPFAAPFKKEPDNTETERYHESSTDLTHVAS